MTMEALIRPAKNFAPRDVERSSIALFGLACIWIGLNIGVSFLATPAKFLAPSLPLAVALDVGRQTFGVFSKVEWILGMALVVLAVLSEVQQRVLACSIVTVIAVILESVWLLPLLDARVGMIIAGQQPPASHLHTAYIAFEIIKLMTLIVIAVSLAKRTAIAGTAT